MAAAIGNKIRCVLTRPDTDDFRPLLCATASDSRCCFGTLLCCTLAHSNASTSARDEDDRSSPPTTTLQAAAAAAFCLRPDAYILHIHTYTTGRSRMRRARSVFELPAASSRRVVVVDLPRTPQAAT